MELVEAEYYECGEGGFAATGNAADGDEKTL